MSRRTEQQQVFGRISPGLRMFLLLGIFMDFGCSAQPRKEHECAFAPEDLNGTEYVARVRITSVNYDAHYIENEKVYCAVQYDFEPLDVLYGKVTVSRFSSYISFDVGREYLISPREKSITVIDHAISDDFSVEISEIPLSTRVRACKKSVYGTWLFDFEKMDIIDVGGNVDDHQLGRFVMCSNINGREIYPKLLALSKVKSDSDGTSYRLIPWDVLTEYFTHIRPR